MARVWILAALLLVDVTPRGELFRVGTARQLGTLQLSKAAISSIAFSRDGRRLVALDTGGTLSVWDLPTRRSIRTIPGAFFRGRIDLSADGTVVAGLSSNRQSIRILDLEKGTEIRSIPEAWPLPYGFDLSPDGRRIVVLRRDQSVKIFNVADGEETKQIVEPNNGQGGQPTWSPDGKTLVCHGWDSQVRIFDVEKGDTTGTFSGIGPQAAFVGFSPDSSTIVHAAQDSKIRLYDRSGRQTLELGDTVPGTQSVAFSRDGLLMAAVDIRSIVRIWDPRTGRKLREFEAGPVTQAVFTPTAATSPSPPPTARSGCGAAAVPPSDGRNPPSPGRETRDFSASPGTPSTARRRESPSAPSSPGAPPRRPASRSAMSSSWSAPSRPTPLKR